MTYTQPHVRLIPLVTWVSPARANSYLLAKTMIIVTEVHLCEFKACSNHIIMAQPHSTNKTVPVLDSSSTQCPPQSACRMVTLIEFLGAERKVVNQHVFDKHCLCVSKLLKHRIIGFGQFPDYLTSWKVSLLLGKLQLLQFSRSPLTSTIIRQSCSLPSMIAKKKPRCWH